MYGQGLCPYIVQFLQPRQRGEVCEAGSCQAERRSSARSPRRKQRSVSHQTELSHPVCICSWYSVLWGHGFVIICLITPISPAYYWYFVELTTTDLELRTLFHQIYYILLFVDALRLYLPMKNIGVLVWKIPTPVCQFLKSKRDEICRYMYLSVIPELCKKRQIMQKIMQFLSELCDKKCNF